MGSSGFNHGNLWGDQVVFKVTRGAPTLLSLQAFTHLRMMWMIPRARIWTWYGRAGYGKEPPSDPPRGYRGVKGFRGGIRGARVFKGLTGKKGCKRLGGFRRLRGCKGFNGFEGFNLEILFESFSNPRLGVRLEPG